MLTVSCPAASLTSTTTIFAPSLAKSTAVSRPIPLLAPVISATLFSSRMSSFPYVPLSNLLKVPRAFPRRHCIVKHRLFGLEKVQIVFNHVFAERLPREIAFFHQDDCIPRSTRDLWQIGRCVNVAFEDGGRVDFIAYAVQTCCQQCCISKIWICVRTGDASFYPQRFATPDHAKSRSPVVVAPREASRSPRSSLKAFIRIDGRRNEGHQFGKVGNPAAQKPAKFRRSMG